MSTMWDGSYPPSLFVPPVIPVTGVTAGTPGAFVPGNATIPADIAALRADPVIGNTGTNKPVAAWTVGQYVVLGNASHAHWTSSLWAVGDAPAPVPPPGGEEAAAPATGTRKDNRRDKR